MTSVYVTTRLAISEHKHVAEQWHMHAYRTRTECGCTHGDRRRNGIIVIDHNGKHIVSVIKCKRCASVQSGSRPTS